MIFRRATIRLTVAYTLIQLALFGIFAVGIFAFVTGTFDFDAAEQDGEGAAFGAEQGFELLRMALITFYSSLVVVIPISSWLMARAALRPIKESYDRQQQFVDGASHEMRTPLSIIQGELELALTRSRSQTEYKAAITIALTAVNSLTRLTDDLLKLSRTTREELVSTFAPIDMNAVVRDVVSSAGVLELGPDVRAHLGQAARVRGSRELLAHAIGNAVDNAVKFSDPTGTVEVTTSVAGDVSITQVRDRGIGMTADQVAHAFERFWRADDARSTPGHGLGLALIRQIVGAHGGIVTLDSQRSVGTTLTVTLPLAAR